MKRDLLADGAPVKATLEGGRLFYASFAGSASCEQLAPGLYSVLLEGRSYRVATGSRGELSVRGRTFHIETYDPRDSRTGSGKAADHGTVYITSPMPGKVVRVLVAVGDRVESGQGLVVVEAMKMQNEMKTPRAGIVQQVRASPEAAVAAGEILVVVE